MNAHVIGFVLAAVTIASAQLSPVQVNGAKGSSSPKVSAEFEVEVSQLASRGLTLKEALEASLEGAGRYLAAIFQQEKPKAPNEAFEFRIIEADGGASRTIFRRADFYFSFDLIGEAKLNATDINGDGLKEIIVQSSSGGNCWSCNPTEIYQVRNHKVELIAAGPVQKITDLNGDGVRELLVTDSRWESYDDLSHAASPGAVMVYTWRNGKYIYAARDFAPFYKAELEQLRKAIEDIKSQITEAEFSDESYVGLAISVALTYAHMGDPERGLKELEALLTSNLKSREQSKHRAVILDDFRKGDSFKKLREMKYGDPIM
jgi:hypothetical protein